VERAMLAIDEAIKCQPRESIDADNLRCTKSEQLKNSKTILAASEG
jgi:hypothetical protein